MLIQWLKRLFRKGPAATVTPSEQPSPSLPAPSQDVSPGSTQPGPSPVAHALGGPVLDLVPPAAMFKVVNESIDIARKTRDADTFASRLRLAADRLTIVEHHSRKYGEPVAGIEQAREAIDMLATRGPLPSKATPRGKPRAAKKTAKTTKVKPSGTPRRPMGRPDIPVEFALSPWLSSTRTDDSGSRSEQFWSDIRRDAQAGEFWADQARRAKDDSQKRLQIAMKVLPLPAAFHEAAISVRAMIRDAKKDKRSTGRQLELLYWLAAVSSFSVPYAERSRQPGFNVMEVGSGAEIAALPFNYDSLGYEKLDLLTATDKHAIAVAWGEPGNHSTLNELHRDAWERYEDLSIRVHDRRMKRLLDQI